MWAMNKFELLDADSPRPNLNKIPGLDEMLELYEKVLAEINSAISLQKEFAADIRESDANLERQDIV